MKGTLSLVNSTLAYADLPATSNPLKRYFDWAVQRNYQVENPKADLCSLSAGQTLDIFNGSRSTSIGNDTVFTITLSPLSNDRYRFTKTAGTAPALRTDRSLTTATHTLTLVVNANRTLSVTSSTAGDFSSVQVGDEVFIPGTSTGDSASPFSANNEGLWTVLAKDTPGTVLQLVRPTGTTFSAASEVVLVVANANFQAYSAAGVQINDNVDITIGFPSSVLKLFKVVAVNTSWFEVISTSALPLGAGTPTTAGIAFYTNAKRYIKVEADQDCLLEINGDTNPSAGRLSPWVAGDADNTAFYEKVGPTYSLTVVNRSSQTLNILVISCE